jgi:hypothetical protein
MYVPMSNVAAPVSRKVRNTSTITSHMKTEEALYVHKNFIEAAKAKQKEEKNIDLFVHKFHLRSFKVPVFIYTKEFSSLS